ISAGTDRREPFAEVADGGFGDEAHQVVAVAHAFVQRGCAHADPVGDGLHGQAGDARCLQDVVSGLDDLAKRGPIGRRHATSSRLTRSTPWILTIAMMARYNSHHDDDSNPDTGAAMSLAPHLHRIGNDIVAAYLVDTDEGVTVIDAGMAGHWHNLQAELADMGRSL